MPQFDVSTFSSQIFWLVVSFSFLLVIMVRYLIPRFDHALQLRQKYMRTLLEEAKNIDLSRDKIAKRNKEKLTQAHQKSEHLFHAILQEADQEKKLLLKEFEEEVQSNKLKEQNVIHKDLKSLERKIPSFVQEATDHLIKEVLPGPVYRKLENSHD
jgi:F-type H+-transporting ATPase subunit b